MRSVSTARSIGLWFAALLMVVTAPDYSRAQSPPPESPRFTLPEALRYADTHYPIVRAAIEEATAAADGVRDARTSYLPRLDALWQANRATVNNVFGLILPQATVPPISGPELASSGQSVWGSAAGALLTWEPFDFGLRAASVESARTVVARATANEALTKLDVQRMVAAAFFAASSAEQGVVAAEADLARRDVLGRTVHTLVDNQLRPGAEASRVDAERALAATRVAQAKRDLVIARATLTRMLGVSTGLVTVNASRLLEETVPETSAAPAPTTHPFVRVRAAAVEERRAREQVLAQTYRPRVYLQSSIFARGSGANPDGTFDGGANGLGLERTNWATGVQVVLPNLFDLASLRARRSAAAASTRAETARYDEAVLQVTAEQQASAALVDAARTIAANTRQQVTAAQQAEAQARARYEAGLASISEVAEAQNLLAQAEFQQARSRFEVWQALFAQALAKGDVMPVIRQLDSSPNANAP